MPKRPVIHRTTCQKVQLFESSYQKTSCQKISCLFVIHYSLNLIFISRGRAVVTYFTKYKVHAIGLAPEFNFMVRFHVSLNLESSCGFERGVYIEIGTVVFVFLQRKQGLKCSMHIAPAHHHHHQYCRESPSHPARRAREAETLMQ